MVGRIIGNYQITDELAKGSMGVVYRGHHINLPRDVVIKETSLSHFPVSTRVQLKARFRREAFIQAQLDHPGIVRLYESFPKGDNYYFVMEYVPGVSLQELLLRQGLPTPAQAIYLCKQALSALDYAHNFHYLTESDVQRTGLFHRDLKPANLLVDGRGRLKITDFGIVKMPDNQSMAAPSFRPGTSEYMPPEQLRGLDLDARSDIYSLGVTFYEMLTGQLPHSKSARNPDEDLQVGVMDLGPMSISEIRSDIPPSLASIFMRAIVRNSSERFQTAAEFLKAIKEYERSSGATEIPSGPLVAKLPPARPDAVTIVEIAAAPEKQALIAPPMTPPMEPVTSSLQISSTPAISQQIESQNPKMAEAPVSQQSISQDLRSQLEIRAESLTRKANEPGPGQQQSTELARRIAVNGSEKESRGGELFEYMEIGARNSRKTLIAVAAAAVLLTIIICAYFLTKSQGGAEITAQKLESGVTANVTSAVTTANAATPEPEPPEPAPSSGDIGKLQEARQADKRGKFKQAATLYEEYLRSGPTDAEAARAASQLEKLKKFIAYINLARSSYNRKEYGAAREYYAEALKLRPYSRMVQGGLARSQARLSKDSNAPSSGEASTPRSESNPDVPKS